MIRLIIVLVIALFTTEVNAERVCNSTIFGYPGDKWAGGDALHLKRPVNATDVGIAHRTWPMGSWVLVKHLKTGKMAVAQVIDRGPYGAIHEGEWVLKRKRSEPGKWRGCADLTPNLAAILGHDGFDRVRIWRLKIHNHPKPRRRNKRFKGKKGSVQH